MFRAAFALAALTLFCALGSAGQTKERPKKGPVIETDAPILSGDIADEKLAKEKPENGVIVSQKGWEKLVKAWGIKNAPKIDFDKELLIVETSAGSGIGLTIKLDNKGDLKVNGIFTLDLKPGFRYVIHSASKKGVKTVNGKELPKE